MVQRYILAFICSAALMAFWVSFQPEPPKKVDPAGETKPEGKDKNPGEKDPAPAAELKPGKPGESTPGKPEKPAEPADVALTSPVRSLAHQLSIPAHGQYPRLSQPESHKCHRV